MAFNKIPEVIVRMSVYDYAGLLRSYAPKRVSVWYSPSGGKLNAGLRDTADCDVVLDTAGEVSLDKDLDGNAMEWLYENQELQPNAAKELLSDYDPED